MRKVAIIDYGMGNLDSIARAVEECGAEPVITSRQEDLDAVSNIILPGVGAFADGMANIRRLNLDKILAEKVLDRKIPALGICLGMQLMATNGIEGGKTGGLGWIKGEVIKLVSDEADIKIPHIGWNEVNFEKENTLFDGIPKGKDFYFVHSFHFKNEDQENILALTPYCGQFVSAVVSDNIYGVQFHPEKSQKFGLRLIRNFLSL